MLPSPNHQRARVLAQEQHSPQGHQTGQHFPQLQNGSQDRGLRTLNQTQEPTGKKVHDLRHSQLHRS